MGLSVVLHVIVLPVVLIWMVADPPEHEAPKSVMTVSLGGAPGPRSGGMTPMSARAAEAAPPTARAGAACAAGGQGARDGAAEGRCAQDAASRDAEEGADDAKGRTTPTAAETRQGSAVAETGATTGRPSPGSRPAAAAPAATSTSPTSAAPTIWPR